MRLPALIAVACAAAFTGVVVPLADASFPGRNGRIAATGHLPCAGIWTFPPNGGDVAAVLRNHCGSGTWGAPAQFSPDGRTLLYAYQYSLDPYARGRLFTVRVDGRGGRRLPLRGVDGTWAPDGRHIAYVRAVGDPSSWITGRRGVWRARLDGTRRRRLAAVGARPLWSPDGRLIALVARDASGTQDLRLVDARSGALVRSLGPVFGPFDFSPDGARFLYQPVDGGLSIVETAAAGSPRPISITGLSPFVDGRFQSAVWSPDGRSIAFLVEYPADGDEFIVAEVYVVAAAGGRARRIRTFPSGLDDMFRGALSWQALPRRMERPGSRPRQRMGRAGFEPARDGL